MAGRCCTQTRPATQRQGLPVHQRPARPPHRATRGAAVRSRKGQCWDNAVTESFFATIKTELLDRRAWPTRTSARTAIFDWIEGWHNTRRRHSTLGYLSPAAYQATAYTSRPPGKVA